MALTIRTSEAESWSGSQIFAIILQGIENNTASIRAQVPGSIIVNNIFYYYKII